MFLVIAVSLFSVIFTVNKCYQYKDEVAQKDNIINSIGSKYTKTDNGGKVDVIETNAKDFSKIKTDDPEIKRLQTLVKKYEKELKNKGSVTVIEESIKHDTSFIKKPNIVESGCVIDYIDTINNRDIYTTFGRKGDTVLYSLSLNNTQTTIFKEEGSLFKKKKLVLTIENSNRYFNNESARTVSTYDFKQSKLGLGGHLGMGVTKEMKLTPVISFGVNYNFVNF